MVVVVDVSFTGDFFWGTWRVVERFSVDGPSSSQAKKNRELPSRLAAFLLPCSAALGEPGLEELAREPQARPVGTCMGYLMG